MSDFHTECYMGGSDVQYGLINDKQSILSS